MQEVREEPQPFATLPLRFLREGIYGRIDPARRSLKADKAVLCLRMLLEGNSIRSTERLTEVHRDTIIATMVDAGQKCELFLARAIRKVHANDVQADEIWDSSGASNARKKKWDTAMKRAMRGVSLPSNGKPNSF